MSGSTCPPCYPFILRNLWRSVSCDEDSSCRQELLIMVAVLWCQSGDFPCVANVFVFVGAIF